MKPPGSLVNAAAMPLLVAAMVAGCIVRPQDMGWSRTDRGELALSSVDAIAVFVSTEAPAEDPLLTGIRISGIGDPAAVAEGFREGFLARRPDARVVVADEALRKTCFEPGQRVVTAAGSVVLAPTLDSERCRTLLGGQGIRYIASIGGLLQTTTATPGAGVIPGPTLMVMGESRHAFALDLVAVDARTHAIVLEDCERDTATTTWAIIVFPPVPFVRVLDEGAYWKRAGWNAGNKMGSCFAAPGADEAPR